MSGESVDIEKTYTRKQNIMKLERLLESLKNDKIFEIQVDRRHIKVPSDANFSIEYEDNGSECELEFQFKWHSV